MPPKQRGNRNRGQAAQLAQPALANQPPNQHANLLQATQAAQAALAGVENNVHAFAAQLPVLFPAVALQNIADEMNNRFDQVMNRLDRMDNRLDRMDARVTNGSFDHALNDHVVWPPPEHDAPALPDPQEETWADVQDLELEELRPYMLSYRLGIQGDKSTQLKQLRRYIGLRLANT